MHHTPDHILVQKIQEGNKLAFDSLFFKYYKTLHRFALNICNNSTIAEDSVQNTFIKIWNNNHKLNPDDKIGKLLFTYTKNETIDEIRKQNTRKKHEGSAITEVLISDTDFNDDKCIAKAIIETAINQLPKKSKEIFRLAKQDGLTVQEIAKYLNLSNKTVENQITNAYRKLRQILEPFKNQLNS